jgi:thiamine biosynthesis protein ThiS
MFFAATQTVKIVVNGVSHSVPRGLTVADLLAHLGIEPDRVAVELNREIVRQARWIATVVDAGAQVEIVQFVGGG